MQIRLIHVLSIFVLLRKIFVTTLLDLVLNMILVNGREGPVCTRYSYTHMNLFMCYSKSYDCLFVSHSYSYMVPVLGITDAVMDEALPAQSCVQRNESASQGIYSSTSEPQPSLPGQFMSHQVSMGSTGYSGNFTEASISSYSFIMQLKNENNTIYFKYSFVY